MNEPDPGYTNPDRSRGFRQLLASLDHFQKANYVRAARRAMHQALRPEPGMRLLDAGCGTGLDVARLARRVGLGGEMIGLDISNRFLEVARARYGHAPNAHWIAGTLDALPFADASFNGVCSMRTVQYLDEPLRGICELSRVTRPGGRVVAVEGGMATVDLQDSELTRLVFGHGSGPSLGVRLANLMQQAGLTSVTVAPGFGFELGKPDPKVVEYARGMAADAVEEGIVTAEGAGGWLANLESIVEEGRWFSADCMFVVAGTVGLSP